MLFFARIKLGQPPTGLIKTKAFFGFGLEIAWLDPIAASFEGVSRQCQLLPWFLTIKILPVDGPARAPQSAKS